MLYLALLLSLLPFATPTPTGGGGGHHGPGNCPSTKCLSTSVHDMSWALSIEYHAFWAFTNPAHQNSWGTVTLNLTNPAIPNGKGRIHCEANSNRLTDFFYGDHWFPCVDASGGGVPLIPETTFRFFTHNRFDLNQTWICPESLKRGKKDVKFNALATTNLEMECTDVSWLNPNWTIGSGEFYSTRDVKCTPVKLNLKPYEERIVL